MNTSDDTSLLAHLAYKFGGGETVATEALGYILDRYPSALAALRDVLKVDGADVGPLVRVETEKVNVVEGKRDRIDLAAYDEAGAERVLVEVKFWADLEDNQPAEYLRRLPDDDHLSVLLFVVPEYRLETLWPKIRDMAQRESFTLKDMPATGHLRAAAVAGGNRRLMLTSWRSLLKEMRSRAATDGDSSAEQDIRQLNGLCEQEDAAAFLPLTAAELGPEFPRPRRMCDFRRLVDDAVELLVQKGRAKVEGLRGAPRTKGYGRYFHIGRNSAWAYAWLGMDYELYKTPIWIQFDNAETAMLLNEILKRLGRNDRDVPLRLRTGVEYKEVIEDLVNQLCELADRLAPASEAS